MSVGGSKGREAPLWRPNLLAERLPYLRARGRIEAAVRDWFVERGFVEVQTPALQVSPGMEPHLKAFATSLETPAGERQARYLHTSPEFAMKKLLAGGVPRPFQFARAYRNGERSALHHPEFTMLEWYRAREGYDAVMADCASLLHVAVMAAGRSLLTWNGDACDPAADIEMLTVADAFARYANMDLLASTRADPADPDLSALAQAAAPLGIAPHDGDRWEDLFFRIMFERIEPRLGFGAPTLLYEYPVSMAALARAKPGNRLVAERFELYVCGVELANGYGELTDAAIQRRRFEADMALKERLYGDRYPVDEDFLAALEHGLPECSGVALGFDRLAMLASGAARIEDVLWLPVAE
ncbi:MAG: EF-P lysine aminoacylase EpmA [Reyranellaceae bacterium]